MDSEPGLEDRSVASRPPLLPVAGLIHAVLSIISLNMLLATPDLSSSDSEILEYFSSPNAGGRALFALNLMAISIIAFLWFIGVIRSRIGRDEPKFFGTIFLGGGILYAALNLFGAAALAAPSLLVGIGGQVPDPGAASMARSVGAIAVVIFMPRMQALFVFSTAALGSARVPFPAGRCLSAIYWVSGFWSTSPSWPLTSTSSRSGLLLSASSFSSDGILSLSSASSTEACFWRSGERCLGGIVARYRRRY